MVYVLASMFCELSKDTNARKNAQRAIKLLDSAVALHKKIAQEGVTVADEAAAYQANWRDAMKMLLVKRSSDFDYLEMLD